MKFIDSSYTILKQNEGLKGIYEQIERAGRTCYKSENKIEEGSAENFTQRMIISGHTAMLEHGTVYLKISHESPLSDPNYLKALDAVAFYKNNKYSVCKEHTDDHFHIDHYITTNYRVIVENHRENDIVFLCEPTEFHEKRITVKFIIDRATSQSMCRHRVFSFAQESTRYCNYSKDKFNNELVYIIPRWMYNLRDRLSTYVDSLDKSSNEWMLEETGEQMVRTLTCKDRSASAYWDLCKDAEDTYMFLTDSEESEKLKAEDARGVLPLDIKTEIVMTGTLSQWESLFKLRVDTHAQPNIRYIMTKLKEELDNIYGKK